MVISQNSQLGLMMESPYLKKEFLELMMKRNKDLVGAYKMMVEILENKKSNDEQKFIITDEELNDYSKVVGNIKNFEDFTLLSENVEVKKRVDKIMSAENDFNFIDNTDSKLYLICNGVEKCSKMIHIGDNFTSKALRNIEFGKHTYLMGKDEVCRFMCKPGAIKGIYWNRAKEITFEFGFDVNDDGYYFDELYLEYFNKVAKIITFVELGDIEVLMLEKGRNNGKQKKDGKITNTSPFTVYVVDSSWNKLIIRTEGFAVMGHFRLQPCGKDFCDRKLTWINAFEKHGYKRRPKASILHNQ